MVQEYRLMEGSNGQSRGKVKKGRAKKGRSNTWRTNPSPRRKDQVIDKMMQVIFGDIGKQDEGIGGYS
jgi:hypothetical protein